MPNENRLLTKAQLADRTTLSASSIDRLRARGLPCLQVGHRILFNWDTCLDWLSTNGQPLIVGKEVAS